jgi:hypothetical protein
MYVRRISTLLKTMMGALLLACIASASMGASPGPPPPDEWVGLHLLFKRGEVTRYRADITTSWEQAARRDGRRKRSHLSVAITQTVLKVDRHGSARIRTVMAPYPDGGSPASPDRKTAVVMISTVTPTGQEDVISFTDNAKLMRTLGGVLNSLLWCNNSVRLPSHPVRSGDSWEAAETLQDRGLKASGRSTLMNVTEAETGRAAHIHTDLAWTQKEDTRTNILTGVTAWRVVYDIATEMTSDLDIDVDTGRITRCVTHTVEDTHVSQTYVSQTHVSQLNSENSAFVVAGAPHYKSITDIEVCRIP